MNIHFSKDSISARPDCGYYSPEKLNLLKRIFDTACKEAHVTEKAIRDDLANKLLTAGKTFEDEDRLTEFMKNAVTELRP